MRGEEPRRESSWREVRSERTPVLAKALSAQAVRSRSGHYCTKSPVANAAESKRDLPHLVPRILAHFLLALPSFAQPALARRLDLSLCVSPRRSAHASRLPANAPTSVRLLLISPAGPTRFRPRLLPVRHAQQHCASLFGCFLCLCRLYTPARRGSGTGTMARRADLWTPVCSSWTRWALCADLCCHPECSIGPRGQGLDTKGALFTPLFRPHLLLPGRLAELVPRLTRRDRRA